MQCPTLLTWTTFDDMGRLFDGDPLALWRAWATDMRGMHVDSGHHQAEQAPEQLAARLIDFLGHEPASA